MAKKPAGGRQVAPELMISLVEKIQRHEELKELMKPYNREYKKLHEEIKEISEGIPIIEVDPENTIIGRWTAADAYDVPDIVYWDWGIQKTSVANQAVAISDAKRAVKAAKAAKA